MLASVRAMFANIVDYAGMFPPAQLPLEQAIRNYARYRTEPESWMLGRFVCPAGRLEELSPFVEELFREGPPLAVSALGRSSRDLEEFKRASAADLAAIASFRSGHGRHVLVDRFETALPDTLPAGPLAIDSVQECVRDIVSTLGDQNGSTSTRLFIEAPPGVRKTQTEVVIDLANACAKTWPGPGPALPAGFKVRCGGATPAAVPSPEFLAGLLTVCISLKTPLKFTAGLHHPMCQFSDETQAYEHGFLNVFAAGILAQVRYMFGAVQEIIEDEQSAHFRFHENSMCWKDLRPVTTDEIRDVRQHLVISFGSCSFDEPRDGLRALGLIP